ncbi:MAG: S1/P1 nuclease, partial [bacterium]
MIKPSNFLILTLLLCFIIPCKSFSWSEKGHRIIAKIAEERLSAKARKGIKEILGKESLPQVSTWMDFIRSDHNLDFSNSYHYV